MPQLDIGQREVFEPTFEIVLHLRDKEGKPIGQKKSYITSNPSKLHDFWIRNSGTTKKKRKKVEAASSEKDIQQAIKEVQTYTQEIRRKKKLEE